MASHRRTVSHPTLLHTPNSVHALSGTSFLATNDHFVRARDHPLAQQLETYAALPGGSVVHVTVPESLDNDESITVKTLISHLPFANGIALLNASTLAVASTTARSVRLFHLNATADEISLSLAQEIRAPALLDNLSVDSSGRLLAAGHPRPGALTATVVRRSNCIRLTERVLAAAAAAAPAAENEEEEEVGALGEDQQVMDGEDMTVKTVPVSKAGAAPTLSEAEKEELVACEQRYDETSPSWVGELVLDAETGEGRWRELYVGSEGGYGASTTAARDVKEGVVLVVGLYEKGVLVGRE